MVSRTIDERIKIMREKIRKKNAEITKLQLQIENLQTKSLAPKADYILKLEYTEDYEEVIIKDNNLRKKFGLEKNGEFFIDNFKKKLDLFDIGTIFLLRCYLTKDGMTNDTPNFIRLYKILSKNPLQLKEEERCI